MLVCFDAGLVELAPEVVAGRTGKTLNREFYKICV